ncbi:CTR copper uptake transporter [Mycena chlorophos]|uniref:Copper transport protein n=1 Tax=Mycena chlorophos TaxID=658473 RepID=A0A8H6WEV8_MYCCL|nr:CTR copper uptake transporter [Mycena chlorophos]
MSRRRLQLQLPLAFAVLALALASIPLVQAQLDFDERALDIELDERMANGDDMSMDDGMTMANGTMMPMLHFSLGDTLFFEGWVPQTKAAQFGACVGLLVLTLVDRWLGAMRALMEASWRRSVAAASKAQGHDDCDDDKNKKAKRVRLQAPPFVFAHDASRGAMQALQSTFTFIFMLAVMTFNAAYIITIIGGLGVGEMLFGRYRATADYSH